MHVPRPLLYALPIAMQGVATVGSVFLLTQSIGLDTWAVIAVGQSLGVVGLTAALYGWPITGPSQVASSASPYSLYVRSLQVRIRILPPITAAGVLITTGLQPSEATLAAASFVATALGALTSTWFFAGLDDPGSMIRCEAFPRSFMSLAGAGLVATGAPVMTYVLSLVLGVAISFALTHMTIRREFATTLSASGALGGTAAVNPEGAGALTYFVMNGFISLPVVLVAYFGSPVLAPLALMEKLFRQGITATTPVLHSRIASLRRCSEAGVSIRVAARKNLKYLLLAATASGVIAAVGIPAASAVLSSDVVRVGPLEASLFGGWFGLSFLTHSVPSAVLAPLGLVARAAAAHLSGGALTIVLIAIGLHQDLVQVLAAITLGQLLTAILAIAPLRAHILR